MNIFKWITGNVIKWWHLVMKPVLRIDNNESGQVESVQPKEQLKPEEVQSEPEQQFISEKVQSASERKQVKPEEQQRKPEERQAKPTEDRSAMDFIERMNAEKEEKRKKLLEQAQEQARINEILNANKVNVEAFIQVGKDAIQEKEEQKEKIDGDVMARAQEIMDRLNKEAAEDEAKKQAQIEEAKRQAKETFGV